MARLLLNLRHVPDDEAQDVRALLNRHDIDYYETPPSRWGISMGGIWLRHDEDYPRARQELDGYQARRAERARADYAARKRRGEVESFIGVLRRRPLEVLACLGLVAVIVVLMMWPVWLSME